MSSLFIMRPMTVDGLPVSGMKVVIPIVLNGEAPPGPYSWVARVAPWASTPTPRQMADAFPKAVVGKISSGRVVLRCDLLRTGLLRDCDPISESPKGWGFAHAALTLAKAFRADFPPNARESEEVKVDVPFDFRDPSRPSPPVEVLDPVWLKQFNGDALARVFPPAAIKAGVRLGSAKVNCVVTHDGRLQGCAVADEEPAHLGFGQAALSIAAAMQMNPWTSSGDPVDGARVDLPIKMVLPRQDPKPAVGATEPGAATP